MILAVELTPEESVTEAVIVCGPATEGVKPKLPPVADAEPLTAQAIDEVSTPSSASAAVAVRVKVLPSCIVWLD